MRQKNPHAQMCIEHSHLVERPLAGNTLEELNLNNDLLQPPRIDGERSPSTESLETKEDPSFLKGSHGGAKLNSNYIQAMERSPSERLELDIRSNAQVKMKGRDLLIDRAGQWNARQTASVSREAPLIQIHASSPSAGLRHPYM